MQGLTAGRIPGERPDPELEGFKIYQRPLGKSGGHGIGWSEIPQVRTAAWHSVHNASALSCAAQEQTACSCKLFTTTRKASNWNRASLCLQCSKRVVTESLSCLQYSFRVPNSWKETPVSIADAGGTEIDVRMSSRDEGELSMVVAPVLRFRDVGYNANVDMAFLGDPDKIIAGFTPELYGAPLVDGDVQDTKVYRKDGELYYQWRMKPHRYVVATATGNRVFLLAASANSRQFRKSSESLQTIVDSLYVPPAKAYNVGY